MKQFFSYFLIIFCLFLTSCSKYSNLFDVTSSDIKSTDKSYYQFENDTIKISYSFWAKNGKMSFTVFNKLNIPIYIDWKKSSVVKNDQKVDYWVDEVKTKSRSTTSMLYYSNFNTTTKSSSESKSVKPERITFVSPKSSVTRVQTELCIISPDKIPSPNAKTKLLSSDGKTNISVKYADIDEQSSPFIFRNFLTISTNEKFDNEIYIDNRFYVSKVYKIKSEKVTTLASFYNSKTNKTEIALPISSHKQFYINIKN